MHKRASDKELNQFLAQEMEGKLYAHISVHYIASRFSCVRDLYTVKDGKVCILENGKLIPTGDNLWYLKNESRRIGVYNPSKQYKKYRSELSYAEMRKALKLN